MTNKPFETPTGPKQSVRDALVSLARDHLPAVRKILTLPGRQALCVRTFRAAFPEANIRGVERKKEDWQAIVDQGVDCVLGTVQDYAAQHTTPSLHHDLVFLDYFSFLNDDVLGGLQDIIRNPNIVHPGRKTLLGITLMKSIRQDKDEMLEFIRANVYLRRGEQPENTLEQVGLALQAWITRGANRDYFQSVEELYATEYRASEGSALMYFFAFLLEK